MELVTVIRIIKYFMLLVKFYENFMIFLLYDRVKFYAILCRVRPMRKGNWPAE